MLLCYIYFADIYVHVFICSFHRSLLKIGIIRERERDVNVECMKTKVILYLQGW